MKIYKIIVGILLFGAPITFHVAAPYYQVNMPIGTISTPGGNTYFALHNFQLYTQSGRMELVTDIENSADYDLLALYSYGMDLSVEGLMTIIILWGLAFYIILSAVDNKILNLISDFIMIGFAVMSLIIFLNFSKELIITPEFGLPIFTIVAGLLAIGGLIHSVLELKK